MKFVHSSLQINLLECVKPTSVLLTCHKLVNGEEKWRQQCTHCWFIRRIRINMSSKLRSGRKVQSSKNSWDWHQSVCRLRSVDDDGFDVWNVEDDSALPSVL